MVALAVAVGLSSIAIGSILSTALLIGPAATALRLTQNLRSSLVVACVLGVVTTWLGILFAYDSNYWMPSSQGLPVSSFIVAIAFFFYLVSGLSIVRRRGIRLDRETRRPTDNLPGPAFAQNAVTHSEGLTPGTGS
jgi:zinc/manganese transport system permease protein